MDEDIGVYNRQLIMSNTERLLFFLLSANIVGLLIEN